MFQPRELNSDEVLNRCLPGLEAEGDPVVGLPSPLMRDLEPGLQEFQPGNTEASASFV